MSNLLERAFGGDSLGPDSKRITPRALPTRSGKQRLTFLKYLDTYNEEGIEYIVEKSTDLRHWTTAGVSQVDLDSGTGGVQGAELGGGMERVVYETDDAVVDGKRQFIRLRVRTK